jgi:hypothetical protein
MVSGFAVLCFFRRFSARQTSVKTVAFFCSLSYLLVLLREICGDIIPTNSACVFIEVSACFYGAYKHVTEDKTPMNSYVTETIGLPTYLFLLADTCGNALFLVIIWILAFSPYLPFRSFRRPRVHFAKSLDVALSDVYRPFLQAWNNPEEKYWHEGPPMCTGTHTEQVREPLEDREEVF